jgi:acylphosphatase
MCTGGRIRIRGIVQGVGFRPYVYALACELSIRGTVKNLGSEVEIVAAGARFGEFLDRISKGPPLSRIDEVQVEPLLGPLPDGFSILPSEEGALSGMIPPDVATCADCIRDIDNPQGRYGGYWATSCVNCGPRYSIIEKLPCGVPGPGLPEAPCADDRMPVLRTSPDSVRRIRNIPRFGRSGCRSGSTSRCRKDPGGPRHRRVPPRLYRRVRRGTETQARPDRTTVCGYGKGRRRARVCSRRTFRMGRTFVARAADSGAAETGTRSTPRD